MPESTSLISGRVGVNPTPSIGSQLNGSIGRQRGASTIGELYQAFLVESQKSLSESELGRDDIITHDKWPDEGFTDGSPYERHLDSALYQPLMNRLTANVWLGEDCLVAVKNVSDYPTRYFLHIDANVRLTGRRSERLLLPSIQLLSLGEHLGDVEQMWIAAEAAEGR